MGWHLAMSIGPGSVTAHLASTGAALPAGKGRNPLPTFSHEVNLEQRLSEGFAIDDASPEGIVQELVAAVRELLVSAHLSERHVDAAAVAYSGAVDAAHRAVRHTAWGQTEWRGFPLASRLEEIFSWPVRVMSTAGASMRHAMSLMGAARQERPAFCVDAADSVVGHWSPGASPATGHDLPVGAMRPGTLPLAWPGWGMNIDGLATSRGVLQRFRRILDDEAQNEAHLAQRFRKKVSNDSPGAVRVSGETPAPGRAREGFQSRLGIRVHTVSDVIHLAEQGERLPRSLLLDAATALAWCVAQTLLLYPADVVWLSGSLFQGSTGLVLDPFQSILADELRGMRNDPVSVKLMPNAVEAAVRGALAIAGDPGISAIPPEGDD